jgi:hypothetical protein
VRPSTAPRALLVAAAALLLGTTGVDAGIQVSPVRSILEIPPGGHGSQVLRVRNTGQDVVVLTTRLADWTVSDGTSEGLALHPPATRQRSCSRWVEVWPVELEIGPGESGTLRISVALPDQADGSYFSAVVLATSGIPSGSPGTEVSVALNIGHLVTVHTAGRTTWSAETEGLTLSRPDDTHSLELGLDLHNTGTGAIRPEGSFAIVDEAGEFVGKVDLGTYCAQPGGVVRVREHWDGLLAPGAYRVYGTVEIGGGVALTPEAEFEVRDELVVDTFRATATGGGVRATVRFANPGNISHRLTGVVELLGPSGAVVSSAGFGPTPVLANGTAEEAYDLAPTEPGRHVVRLAGGDDELRLQATAEVVVP